MNDYQRAVAAVALSWSLLLPPALAQPAPAPSSNLPRPVMPATFKTATAIDPASGAKIDQIVLDYFTRMTESDTDVQKAAREAVVMDMRGAAGDPSPAYAARYAQAISAAVSSPAVANAKDHRARFQAALAVAKVAESIKHPKLEPAVLALLADPEDYAVKLTAVKAARWIMPELAKAKAQQKLADRIVQVVKACPAGPITVEAYEALRDKSTIGAMLDVLAARVALYGKGLPDEPNAEAVPFLALQGMWTGGPTDVQKRKLLENACQVLVLAAFHADNQTAGTVQRDQLGYTVQKVAESLSIIAKYLPAPGLDTAAQALARTAGNAAAALSPAVKPVCAEIRKVRGCESFADPKLDPPPSTNPIVP